MIEPLTISDELANQLIGAGWDGEDLTKAQDHLDRVAPHAGKVSQGLAALQQACLRGAATRDELRAIADNCMPAILHDPFYNTSVALIALYATMQRRLEETEQT